MKARVCTLLVLIAGQLLLVGGASSVADVAAPGPSHNLLDLSWSITTPLPQGLANHAATTNGTHIYVNGGFDGSSIQRSSIQASVNPDGSLSSWTATTLLPGPITNHACVSARNWVYILGGWNGSTYATAVYFAPVNPDGSLGNWTATSSLPVGVEYLGATATSDTIYVAGGRRDWVRQSTAYYAHINADGTLTEWTETSSLPKALTGLSMETYGGNVYVIAGESSTGLENSVYRAQIDPRPSPDRP